MPDVYFSFPASLWSSELPCEECWSSSWRLRNHAHQDEVAQLSPVHQPWWRISHLTRRTMRNNTSWGIFICSNWYNGLKNDKHGVPGELKLGQSKRLKVGCFDKSLYIKPHKDIKFSTYVILGFLFVWFQLRGKRKLKKIYI